MAYTAYALIETSTNVVWKTSTNVVWGAGKTKQLARADARRWYSEWCFRKGLSLVTSEEAAKVESLLDAMRCIPITPHELSLLDELGGEGLPIAVFRRIFNRQRTRK